MTKRANTKKLKEWIATKLRKKAPMPREGSYLERKARLIRLKAEGHTPEDAWIVYCSGDPIAWTAHWFNLSQRAVRELQKCPNEGKRWTEDQKADMGRAFEGQ